MNRKKHSLPYFMIALAAVGAVAVFALMVGFTPDLPTPPPTPPKPLPNAAFAQDYEVFATDSGFVVRGQLDRQVVTNTSEAATAINDAIQALNGEPGEVLIHRGSYPLAAPIELPSHTTLRGKGDGTELWITSDNTEGIGVRSERADRSVVRDLAIKSPKEQKNGKTAVLLDHCGDCQVEGLLVVGMQEHGIWVGNNSFLCSVRHNSLADIDSSAIYISDIGPLGRGGSYVPITISENNVYDSNIGIECSRGINVQILGNVVYRAKQYAYYLHTSSNCCLLSANRTFQCYGDGIVVENTHELNINGNMISWQQGHGIVLKDVTWGTVSGNVINDPSSPTFTGGTPMQGYTPRENYTIFHEVPKEFNLQGLQRSGIRLTERVRNVTVIGNAVYCWGLALPMDYGIYEDAQGIRNVIASNTFNYCSKACIRSEGQQTVVDNNTERADSSYLANNRPWVADSLQPVLQIFEPDVVEKFTEDQY
jgi:parallel beta-helix repeat protein